MARQRRRSRSAGRNTSSMGQRRERGKKITTIFFTIIVIGLGFYMVSYWMGEQKIQGVYSY